MFRARFPFVGNLLYGCSRTVQGRTHRAVPKFRRPTGTKLAPAGDPKLNSVGPQNVSQMSMQGEL